MGLLISANVKNTVWECGHRFHNSISPLLPHEALNWSLPALPSEARPTGLGVISCHLVPPAGLSDLWKTGTFNQRLPVAWPPLPPSRLVCPITHPDLDRVQFLYDVCYICHCL